MPKIKILPHAELCPDGAEIDATVGKSVCENLLDHSIDIEHACELSCACTTCHVIFRNGFDSLNESTDDEEDLLDKAWGLEPKSRLSCQTIVDKEDLTIEIPKYTINMVSENHPKKENKNTDMKNTISKKDFSLSNSAIDHISSLLKQNNSTGVRVSVKSSGCSGYAYDLSFVQNAEKDVNSELIFNNPNISAKCGCGESFSIDQNLFNQA